MRYTHACMHMHACTSQAGEVWEAEEAVCYIYMRPTFGIADGGADS